MQVNSPERFELNSGDFFFYWFLSKRTGILRFRSMSQQLESRPQQWKWSNWFKLKNEFVLSFGRCDKKIKLCQIVCAFDEELIYSKKNWDVLITFMYVSWEKKRVGGSFSFPSVLHFGYWRVACHVKTLILWYHNLSYLTSIVNT